MKLIIVFTLFLIIFLSWPEDTKIKTSTKNNDFVQIKELEYLKNLEIYKYNKERCIVLKDLYDQNNKELKQAELACKLSEFDMIISKIILDMNKK